MYSRGHAVVSALVGLPVAGVAPADASPVLAWVAVVVLGVAVDLDHFLLARYNRGDWAPLRRCVRDPALVVAGQDAIFEPGDLWRDQRLLSHALLGGALVAVVVPVGTYWALVAGVALYAHVVADLAADCASRRAYLAESARALEASGSRE